MLACERCHSESVWKPAKSPANQQFNHDDRKDALKFLAKLGLSL